MLSEILIVVIEFCVYVMCIIVWKYCVSLDNSGVYKHIKLFSYVNIINLFLLLLIIRFSELILRRNSFSKLLQCVFILDNRIFIAFFLAQENAPISNPAILKIFRLGEVTGEKV